MHPMRESKEGRGMKFNDRKSINDKLSKYIPYSQDSEFVEITEWTNEEGWDITISDKTIALSRDELDMINFLTKALEYGTDILDSER